MSWAWEQARALIALLRADPLALAASAAAHLELVLEATLLAVALGVPLGVAATRSKPLERAVVGLANVFQTIPSLALLGLLLILFGGTIGKPPALAALVIYGLLPIVKNSVLGIQGIDRGITEAAVGMGMTPWQRLWIVELPLAVPSILGGVRIATVASVGMATIAATIGARGLGGYIFSGIQTLDYGSILLGSIPAAALALACDAALGEAEHALDPRRGGRSRARNLLAAVAVAALVGFALWGAWQERVARPSGETIVIGSKDSAEPVLLGHMLADLVEAHTPLKVDRRLNLGGTLVCYNALTRGGLDAYVEYTGTALTAILKQPPQNDPARVLALVRAECASRDGVAVLDPLGFENTFALVMRRDRAEALGIRRISDLRAHLDTLRIGFGPEFGKRPDGFPGLSRAYGLRFAVRPREMDRNLLYEAVALGSLDVGVGDSTDGRIVSRALVRLEDDLRFFPPYEAVPLVRAETLDRHPGLRAALDRLAGRIDTETMQRLNHEVDGRHRPPAQVAREFLESRGLLP
jgi:osmoprotectant transport system permease protein